MTAETSPDRTRRRLDRALTAAAVIGALCILATAVGLVAGVRPMIFETGSMAPAIPTGSLGLARHVEATQVTPGDVVSVVRDDGVRITHRVESVEATIGDTAILVLRGDANSAPDPNPYTVTSVDKITASIPLAGYFASWLSSPYVLLLQALAAVGLLSVTFAPAQGWRRSRTGHRIVAGLAVAVVVMLGASAVRGVGRAHAALQAQATALGTVTAGRPSNPTQFTCANRTFVLIFSGVRLSWPNPVPQRGVYSYVLKSGSTVIATFAPTQAEELTYDIDEGILTSIINILLGSNGTVTLYQRVGNFESATGLTHTLTTTLIPLGARCKNPGTVLAGGALARSAPSSETSTVPPSESPATSSSAPAESSPSSETPSSEAPSSTAEPSSSPTDAETSSSTPDSSATETTPSSQPPATPTLPPGGDLSDGRTFAVYRDSGEVTIRDAETTEVVYRAGVPSSSTVRWLRNRDVLEIADADGTVTQVEQSVSRWVATVTETPAPPPSSEEPRR